MVATKGQTLPGSNFGGLLLEQTFGWHFAAFRGCYFLSTHKCCELITLTLQSFFLISLPFFVRFPLFFVFFFLVQGL